MSLLDVHAAWGLVVLAANAAVGGWALAADRVERLRVRALWPATVAAQLTVFVQVALGAALVSVEGRQAPQLHALYGFLGIVAVAILFGYRDSLRHRLYLLYGFGGLFIAGLALRGLLVPDR